MVPQLPLEQGQNRASAEGWNWQARKQETEGSSEPKLDESPGAFAKKREEIRTDIVKEAHEKESRRQS